MTHKSVSIDALWEFGSDFHYLPEFMTEITRELPWQDGNLYSTGRGALIELIEFLERNCEFKKDQSVIWIPAYTCYELAKPLVENNYGVAFYDGSPSSDWNLPDKLFSKGDIWILCNYFGSVVPGRETTKTAQDYGVIVIEDHSHAPLGVLSRNSNADYCFASLRKTLPLADGGILWSPAERPLPSSKTERYDPSRRVAAMLGKKQYLENGTFSKEIYRQWLTEAEEHLGNNIHLNISEFSKRILTNLNYSQWNEIRIRNSNILTENIRNNSSFKIIKNLIPDDAMGIVLHFCNQEMRDTFRDYLINLKIYTAVLWPLHPSVGFDLYPSASDFRSKMVFLPTDARYSVVDIKIVSEAISHFVGEND